MPVCPPKSQEQRDETSRWELVVGKALKDWTTRMMQSEGVTRAEARQIVLGVINKAGVPMWRRVWNAVKLSNLRRAVGV
jgi:hypothetical protein